MLAVFNDALHADGSASDQKHSTTQEFLQNYITLAAAYSRNAVFLRDKIRGTTQLLSDTLNLKHQKIAQTISENTLALTNAAVKDSATIRVITVVTLLYLPATFVATLFGMQSFGTDSSGKFTVASLGLWIFVAPAVSLTAATFAYLKWIDRRQKTKAKSREEEADNCSEA